MGNHRESHAGDIAQHLQDRGDGDEGLHRRDAAKLDLGVGVGASAVHLRAIMGAAP
jgi:hypothetical protein